MIDNILQLIKSATEDNVLLLAKKLTTSSGLFVSMNKVLYLQKTKRGDSTFLNTEFLSYESRVMVTSVVNDASFQSGFYSAIIYKGIPDKDKLTTFTLLAESYANNNEIMDLEKFFYSLIDLFQLPQEQKTKNLIGFYGELKFIELIWKTYGISIASNWHTSGVMSKYDFVFVKANFEIKTTIGCNLIIPIKHSQLFNNANNYLIIMSCELNNSGETLNKLVDRLIELEPFKNNIQMQIKLLKERARVSENEANETKLFFKEYRAFKVSSLETITGIPDYVSDIVYNYDFSKTKIFELNTLLFK